MGLERLCADLQQHPVKAHTRHLFQDPLLTWFVLAPKSLRGGPWKQAQLIGCTQEAPQLRTHITHDNSLTFDSSCMGPKSSPIPLDKCPQRPAPDRMPGRVATRPVSGDSEIRPPLWIMQKYLRAGPAKMPLGNWYPAVKNHFNQADFCLSEMKKPTMWSNKSSTAWSCEENQIFEN